MTADRKTDKLVLYGKRFLLIIVTLVILLIAFVAISKALQFRDHNKGFVNEFINQQEDQNDIVFIGSSHVYHAVFPMELWEKYGIASSNLATSSQSFPMSYYTVKEAITLQDPDYIVMDLYYAFSEDNYRDLPYVHMLTDNLKVTDPIKYELIHDLVPRSDRLACYLPIVQYHSRWLEWTKDDLIYEKKSYKGGLMLSDIKVCAAPQLISDHKSQPIPETAEMSLRKIINLCKETDTKLILTAIPWAAAEHHLAYYNYIRDLAADEDVIYLDLFSKIKECGILFETDFRDNGHMNISGGLKMSNYLGAYFRQEYHDIPDHRNDEAYSSWDEELQQYHKKKSEVIKNYERKYKEVTGTEYESYYN